MLLLGWVEKAKERKQKKDQVTGFSEPSPQTRNPKQVQMTMTLTTSTA